MIDGKGKDFTLIVVPSKCVIFSASFHYNSSQLPSPSLSIPSMYVIYFQRIPTNMTKILIFSIWAWEWVSADHDVFPKTWRVEGKKNKYKHSKTYKWFTSAYNKCGRFPAKFLAPLIKPYKCLWPFNFSVYMYVCVLCALFWYKQMIRSSTGIGNAAL